MLKRIMIFLTSILLLLNSALVNATTINGWFLSNPTAVGASILYDGTKGPFTSSILISPNASQVAKVLRGGIAGIALAFAVEQLLGAVDWVLDPANNQIRYKEAANTIDDSPLSPLKYCGSTSSGICSTNPDKACKSDFYTDGDRVITSVKAVKEGVITISGVLGDNYSCNVTWYFKIYPNNINVSIYTLNEIKNSNYNPNLQPVEKTLSLITVAQQVIENAESDNLDAQFAVLAAVTNILSDAEKDDAKAKLINDELENNSKCPSGIVRNGSCWVCDKSLFMPYTRATRDAKTATRGKSCKNLTDTAMKAANATLFSNLINARVQENACWAPPDPNHAIALTDAQNALSLCEN